MNIRKKLLARCKNAADPSEPIVVTAAELLELLEPTKPAPWKVGDLIAYEWGVAEMSTSRIAMVTDDGHGLFKCVTTMGNKYRSTKSGRVWRVESAERKWWQIWRRK